MKIIHIRIACCILAALVVSAGQARAVEGKSFTEMVPMRDGVQLATDVYLPVGEGPWPVVLIRTPYSRGMMKGAMEYCLAWGYACVAQDVRGRFGSHGKAIVFTTETEDGYDTVEWIAAQGWSNGAVGTYGGSAMGITQYAMLKDPPPHLKCQFVEVATPFLFNEVRPNGGFQLALVEGWLAMSLFEPENLAAYYSHDKLDDFWKKVDFLSDPEKVKVPVFHDAGWYDIFAEGGINAFRTLDGRGGDGAAGRQKLRIGPWSHMTFGQRKQAELVFPESVQAEKADPAAWFDWCLKGEDTGADKWPAVRYYVLGDVDDPAAPGNAWRSAEGWPVPSKQRNFYLRAGGKISTGRPEAGEAPLEVVFDPLDPVPTLGGRNLTIDAGPWDQNAIGPRSDVLSFQTDPLESPVEIAGEALVKLFFSADVPDTDLAVKLMDVYPDGRAMLLLQGIQRLKYMTSPSTEELMQPGKVYGVTFPLGNVAVAFNRGHRIRVDVAGSNFPLFDVNRNTGKQPEYTKAQASKRLTYARVHKWRGVDGNEEYRKARVSLYADAERASMVILPVVSE